MVRLKNILKRKRVSLLVFIYALLCTAMYVNAQPACKKPVKFYGDVHMGTPLFWGDVTSIGSKKYPGIAIGTAAGYRFTRWAAGEISLGHGVGVLGHQPSQANDYINKDGIITFTSGNWKLGDVYSRTSFTRVGLRLPVQVFNLFRYSQTRKVEVELAPHIYLNHFKPAIYDIHTNQLLTRGAKPAQWFYSAGGDTGIHAKIAAGTGLYLRTALSWLSDERFEGLSAQPAWNINIMSYTTLGLQFDLEK